MCKETIQLTQHVWYIHVGSRILELASKHKVMFLPRLYTSVLTSFDLIPCHSQFGVSFRVVIFDFQLQNPTLEA